MNFDKVRRKYREKIYKCGDYMDIQIYPVYKMQGKRKAKYKETRECQKRLNDKNSANALSRLINLNFTENDYALHLTYDDKYLPASPEEARKDVQNFIRRLKRVYKKQSAELKYIHVTEKGEQSDRVHHHLIISGGVDRTAIENVWNLGYANTRALQFTKSGCIGLATYVTKQRLLFRRVVPSKNLKRPEATERTGKITQKQLEYWKNFIDQNGLEEEIKKQYPGYALCEIPEFIENDVNGGLYSYIRLIKTQKLGEIEKKKPKRLSS